MPRILVADDNSNIHRTVALALKEAGVEVVAVGNGEAAVRKIAEINPDLVLADIFMPVRSGYEVCEFVKKDPRFSKIPVVLLIGAFDPFDEREAQRVQADAILKKPFVPPDSLLRTVADLLAQSAWRAVPAAAPAAPVERPSRAPAVTPATEYMDQAPEEVAPAKARLDWGSSEQPLAFGTLLESPAAGAATDDTVLTSQRDPTLGEPAFWVAKAAQESDESESEADDAQAKPEMIDEEQWRSIELPEPTSPAAASPVKPLYDVQENDQPLPDLGPLELAPPEDIQTLPDLESFPVPVASVEAAPSAVDTAQEDLPDLKDFAWAQTDAPVEQAASHSEPVQVADAASEAELIQAAGPGLATLAPFLASLTSAASTRSEGVKDPFDFGPVPVPEPEPVSDALSDEAPAARPAEMVRSEDTLQHDQAVIEAIAQRVIDRMQPNLIELVTRELLRPAVQALVQRELEKK